MVENKPNRFSNLSEMVFFIDRYKEFSNQIEGQKIIYFKALFNGLLSGYDSLKSLITACDKKEASYYNIFSILNIKTAEIITHTPFIRNLLSTDGTHGQADLFLSSFIHSFIPSEKKDFFVLPSTDEYYIEEEKSIINGRIDIYIQSINQNKKFGIIIENKLYAGDQYLQLSRYYDYLNLLNYDDQQIMILYLTIDGNDPSTSSIDKKLLIDLKNRNIFRNLSYKTDIKNLLENLIPKIQADKVKYQIEQYVETIKNL